MSKIICVATPRVKPTRRAPRPETTFGAGILRAVPSAGRMPYTPEDEAWYVEHITAANPRNRHFDQLALESEQLDRLCAGYVL